MCCRAQYFHTINVFVSESPSSRTMSDWKNEDFAYSIEYSYRRNRSAEGMTVVRDDIFAKSSADEVGFKGGKVKGERAKECATVYLFMNNEKL